MRSEHPLTRDEQDACTGWRRVSYWRPGERKAVKTRSHRIDRAYKRWLLYTELRGIKDE